VVVVVDDGVWSIVERGGEPAKWQLRSIIRGTHKELNRLMEIV
jgi:hypothetical protein